MQSILVDMIIIYYLSNPFTPNHSTYFTYSTLPLKQNSKRNKQEPAYDVKLIRVDTGWYGLIQVDTG